MSRLSLATPCPVFTNKEAFSNSDWNDSTGTLNFTTANQPSVLRGHPKRKQRHSLQFSIHEDVSRDEQPLKHHTSIFSKPAKRIPGSQSSTLKSPPEPTPATVLYQCAEIKQDSNRNSSGLSQAPKRPSHRLSTVPESTTRSSYVVGQNDQKDRDTHAARRGTIYIPNEDTTMPSLYMGIFSPIKHHARAEGGLSGSTTDVTGIAARMFVRQGRRKSNLGSAPRRAPLLLSTSQPQVCMSDIDRVGQGGGKENYPPGHSEAQRVSDRKPARSASNAANEISAATRKEHQRVVLQSTVPRLASNSSRISQHRMKTSSTSDHVTRVKESNKPAWNGGSCVSLTHPLAVKTRKEHVPELRSKSRPVLPTQAVPSRLAIPDIRSEIIRESHPILSDDVARPALYEEQWLEHQEVAITQLVNKVFQSSESWEAVVDLRPSLTNQLLRTYNTDCMVLMHQRIQASVFFGSLSIPQDTLDQGASLSKDVGRKQRFIDFWLDTYEGHALGAALEVVVGRSISKQYKSVSSQRSPSQSPSRRALQQFIDTFLLRNEDGRLVSAHSDFGTWSYQRILVRSIMLVKALDMIKTQKEFQFPGRLFLTSAEFKSSNSVLQALMQMLNPSVGDAVRALSHMGCVVSHTQLALEEFDYKLENLAVDLRDGVRLTRLVELLLYPAASSTLATARDSDATTIIMPVGEPIEFRDGQSWPLSQHLRIPCQARAVRLWNVQVALGAISNVKSLGTLLDGITAEDIVDGFREKTIRLLWALVGKFGLASLINWKDVAWESRRLRLQLADPTCIELDQSLEEEDTELLTSPYEKCKSALKNWIRLVAITHGHRVRNFTTAFADGRIFKTIINEYEPLLNDALPTGKLSMSERLINLGCSAQFAELFSDTRKAHIFDRDFVLVAASFLCSRLLGPSRSARAAIVIQRGWRKHSSKLQEARKEQKKAVASACATVVCAKKYVSSSNDYNSDTHKIRDDYTSDNRLMTSGSRQLASSPDIQHPASETSGDIWLSL